eukprot:g988.t1
MPTTAGGSQSQYNEGLSSRLGSAQSLLELGGRFSDNFSEDNAEREVGFEMDGLPPSMERPDFGEESVYSAPDSLASSDSNRSDWRRQATPDDCFVAAPGRYQAPHQATAFAGGQQQGQSPAHQLVHQLHQVPVLPLQPTGCVVYAPVGMLMAPASPCYGVMTPVLLPDAVRMDGANQDGRAADGGGPLTRSVQPVATRWHLSWY